MIRRPGSLLVRGFGIATAIDSCLGFPILSNVILNSHAVSTWVPNIGFPVPDVVVLDSQLGRPIGAIIPISYEIFYKLRSLIDLLIDG